MAKKIWTITIDNNSTGTTQHFATDTKAQATDLLYTHAVANWQDNRTMPASRKDVIATHFGPGGNESYYMDACSVRDDIWLNTALTRADKAASKIRKAQQLANAN